MKKSGERHKIQKDLELLYDRLYKLRDENQQIGMLEGERQIGMLYGIDIAIQIAEGSLEPEDVNLCAADV